MKTKSSDMLAFFKIIKDNFLIIFLVTTIFAVGSVFYSLSLPNEYRSFSKISAVSEDKSSNLGALASQFGGLASMAGVSLGGSDVNVIVETLESRDFIKSFIEKEDIAIALFAAKSWERETNKLILDDKIYDEKSAAWVREVEPYQSVEPSLEELFLKFQDIFSYSKNKKTDLLTVSITFYSPEISKQWLDSLLIHLSEYLRDKDLVDAQQSIEFIESQYKEVDNTDLKVTLSQLLQEQYQQLTLAKVKKIFGFEVRDSAFLPEEKAGPKRAFIVIAFTFIGGILGLLLAFLRTYIRLIKHA